MQGGTGKKLSGWLLLLGGGLALAALVMTAPLPVWAEAMEPPPDIASYTIAARYDPATYTLTGTETATYINRTADPIPDLVFHLYLNAFSGPETLWLTEAGDVSRGFGYDPAYPGWLKVTSLRLAEGTALVLEPVDKDATLVRAVLPQPVAPGQAVQVQLEFTAQMPKVFARTGWADEGRFVMAGQWFPKFGVWQDGAWNAYPFHANSEFYADFGSYDVQVTLPEGWVIGATGEPVGEPQANGDGTVTHAFHAAQVIDFAWGASARFREATREVDGVHLRLLYLPEHQAVVERTLDATEGAFRKYSEWYGPYGGGFAQQLTVILVPQDGGGAGGMEYPRLFTAGMQGVHTPACFRLHEVEVVHELGHQWFQAAVATNEAEEPWLDEGFTDYTTVRAMNALFGGAVSDCGGWTWSYLDMRRTEYALAPETSIAGTAWAFDSATYGIAAYSKPAVALTTLERVVGEEAMLRFLRTYYQRYALAHPTGQDVRAVMEETLGAETTAWFWEGLVEGSAVLDAQVASLEGQRATVERRGELCIPSEVRVTYRPGTSETIAWPCERRTLTVEGTAPIAAVEIDPAGKVPLDLNRANNSRRAGPDWPVLLSFTARALSTLQNFFFWGGAAW